jgi:hypothetical protein
MVHSRRVTVARARPLGQAAVPGERESLGLGEYRLDRNESSRGNRGGHRAPPGTAETWKAGPQVPATNDARNVRPAPKTSYATIRSRPTIFSTIKTRPIPPNTRC